MMGELDRNLRKWRLQDPADDWSFDASSIYADYDAGLDVCVSATRRALNRLDYVITGGDLRDTGARIDARSDLPALVRVTVEPLKGGRRTRVSFSAGREWTRDGDEASRILKEEFEHRLGAMRQTQP